MQLFKIGKQWITLEAIQREKEIKKEEKKARREAQFPKSGEKWCEFCDSKGVIHKVNCTRPNKPQ